MDRAIRRESIASPHAEGGGMTTATTLKTLRKAFADFEEAYVGVEAVCRESTAISPTQADEAMAFMRGAHREMRRAMIEVERTKAMEDAT
jgi:hypothetical protein